MTLPRFLVAVVLLGGAAAHGATVDYLHVAASDGGSAGGHAAIRFGSQVYHFQHTGRGILELVRHGDRYFRWRYGVLENRTIRVARIEVEQDTHDRLLARFNQRHLLQGRQLAAAESLAEDRRLLESWLAAGRQTETDRVRGAGLFHGDGEQVGPAGEVSPALSGLRASVEHHGPPGSLRARLNETRRALAALLPTVESLDGIEIDEDRPPRVGYRFSDRRRDLAAQLVALETLIHARRVRRAALRVGPAITPVERGALDRYGVRLRAEVAALLASERPDWGFPALLAMGRLEAIEASLRTGRLVVLDGYRADAAGIPGDDPRAAPFLREVAESARRDFDRARAAVLAGRWMAERDYARLERATNRYLEARAGVEQGAQIRSSATTLLPDRSAVMRGLPRPELAESALTALLAEARRAEAVYARALETAYRYDLFGNNCVTEIFATIDATYDPQVLEARLGGRVEPSTPFVFVPFVAMREAEAAYDPIMETLPSHRIRALSEMKETEHPLLVYLRESNTVTSTIYRRNADDPTFLFFTDDGFLLRPVFGAANLVVGLGPTLAGLARAPFDRGATLRRELRGMAATLPELAFVNVRKGRMLYGPQ